MATFAPPADLTPYEPPANVATVVPVVPAPNPNFELYLLVEIGREFAVVASTPIAEVTRQARLALAFNKLQAAFPLSTTDFAYRQQMFRWFYTVVAPMYD
jgi:hypothetical protein